MAEDFDCKAHEAGSLYAADTSFFPGIGAVSPAPARASPAAAPGR